MSALVKNNTYIILMLGICFKWIQWGIIKIFLLLGNNFEKFINTCLEYYGLDPCHYFISPGLSWDAMLQMTEIELQLISEIEMYLFVEKGMRWGIS